MITEAILSPRACEADNKRTNYCFSINQEILRAPLYQVVKVLLPWDGGIYNRPRGMLVAERVAGLAAFAGCVLAALFLI
jgi:hypothetical protein